MPTQKKTGNANVKTGLPEEIEYATTLAFLKQQLQEARLKAVMTVNVEMIRVYWEVGHTISEKEKKEGWGARVINKLSKDLRNAFPDMKGYAQEICFTCVSFMMPTPTIKLRSSLLRKFHGDTIHFF